MGEELLRKVMMLTVDLVQLVEGDFGFLIVDVVVGCVQRGPVSMEIISCAVTLIEHD